ncbi:hypothetical protein CEXT_592211 [Caerostris extrusa]|uniref:Uncharacterized protein n=1 Tax=Caerostris extrusa TaxID=172846 RepID=A0AAV4RMK8_CAEEX|nr:hypothetical protein CEXT_592211 [Caerostris extrusa]
MVKSMPPKMCDLTRRQNIVTHLPGMKGATKNARISQQCWERFSTIRFYLSLMKRYPKKDNHQDMGLRLNGNSAMDDRNEHGVCKK